MGLTFKWSFRLFSLLRQIHLGRVMSFFLTHSAWVQPTASICACTLFFNSYSLWLQFSSIVMYKSQTILLRQTFVCRATILLQIIQVQKQCKQFTLQHKIHVNAKTCILLFSTYVNNMHRCILRHSIFPEGSNYWHVSAFSASLANVVRIGYVKYVVYSLKPPGLGCL